MARGIKIDIDKYITRLKPFLVEGCTMHEACVHSLVPYTTMVDYVKADEELRRKLEAWQNIPLIEARKSLNKDIKEDGTLALKYLERKKNDEFSLKKELEHSGNIGTEKLTEDELDAKIKEKQDKLAGKE